MHEMVPSVAWLLGGKHILTCPLCAEERGDICLRVLVLSSGPLWPLIRCPSRLLDILLAEAADLYSHHVLCSGGLVGGLVVPPCAGPH